MSRATNSARAFSGFPEGKVRLTPVPAPFFTDLLTEIDHLGELKVTLYAFWALNRKPGPFPYLSRTELGSDELLGEALALPGVAQAQALDEALERTVARGTLLKIDLSGEVGEEEYFFLNSPRGRAAVEGLRRGAWVPEEAPPPPLQLRQERPNVYSLYEQNIGPLTPMIAEVLRDAEATFPEAWIEEAIRIAVENNIRKWNYVQAILDDWRTRGKDDGEDRGDSEKARRRYLESYRKYLER